MPDAITCPDPGALRAALDGERPDLRDHVAGCADCAARQERLAADATRTAALLDEGEPQGVDSDAALRAHRDRPDPSVQAVVIPLRPQRRTPALARIAAAAVAVVAVVFAVTPAGRAAAEELLSAFRAESIQVVPVDVASLDPQALKGLVRLAEVEGLEDVAEPQEVTDLDAAEALAGFRPEALDVASLPAEVTGGAADRPLTVVASAPQEVRVAFAEEPGVPDALRGTTLVLDVPGVVLQMVGGDEGVPALVRGEAGRLGVDVEGGSTLGEVRDALLDLPGLPPATVEALRGIEDWETTLPLPVPIGALAFTDTTVDGNPGVAFGDDTGLGAALVWSTEDRFVGVGGFLPLSEVRRLAEAG